MHDEPTHTDAMIELEGFSKAYDERLAVSELSLRLGRGTILGLVGPNGAGKTTTLRAIAGILAPTRGRIRVAGHDLAVDSIAAKRALAYIPDDPRLFDTLTVWEHLEFVGSAYGVHDFAERADRLLEQFELVDRKRSLAQSLSRGMRQKVAIACGYLHEPEVILLDEPLTGLDPRGIREMKTSIRTRTDAGAAVIISSHLLSMVEDLCTHLLILHEGQCRFFGPITEARDALGAGAEVTLEEIFFRITEGDAHEPVAPPLPPALPPPLPPASSHSPPPDPPHAVAADGDATAAGGAADPDEP